jgi:hypothetical protein
MRPNASASLAPALFLLATYAVDCAADACDTADSNVLKPASSLGEKLICANRPGQSGNPLQRWSEIHNGSIGGTLGEHGRGIGDTAGSYDANIGSWSASGSTVSYTYTGDSTYPHVLVGPDTSNDVADFVFCTALDGDVVAEIFSVVDPIPAASAPNPCGWPN